MATEVDHGGMHLVVIGASAGGVDALVELVTTLPRDFPAPILIAQHLDPSRPSQLQEIFARRSTLPVVTVTDRLRLEPGVVYMIPSNTQVEIEDGHVATQTDSGERPLPSIDLLMTTAAHVYGENLVAVILTGSGSDGASGARDVKASGGTVIIQNPETAAHSGMPLSLAPTTVDIVADLETIGGLLQELITGSFLIKPPTEDAQFQQLLSQLRDISGIDFSNYRAGTIRRRLQRRIVATGAADLAAYIRFAQRNPAEYQKLANSFLIKVTEFFRDPDLFDYLRHEVFPTLAAEALTRGELRVWSAGCATGEEAYSLAILASEALGDGLERVSVRIFATDLDEDAIAFARRGLYPAAALGELAPETVERYFSEVNGAYEVRKAVRGLVVFGQHDLAQRSPFPRIDLALCRNVLMYFTPELQKRALQLFAFALRDSGLLVLGKAETVSLLPEYFALQHPRLKVFRRVGDHVLIPPSRIRAITPLKTPTPTRAVAVGPTLARARQPREQAPPPTPIKAERALASLPDGVVIVTEQYGIQFINPAARRLLGIHGSAVGEDLFHVVQYVPISELRGVISSAFRGEGAEAVFSTDSLLADTQEDRRLEVSCAPLRDEADAARIEAALLRVVDVTQRDEERRALAEANGRLRRITEAHRNLVIANEELTVANTRARSINEELLVSNEEFQAATEEVETLNEEMQATNEELEALNEELQATVEELNTANEDLQARGVELQELAANIEEQRHASEAERARLQVVLANMSDAVMLIDNEGRTLLTNAAFRTMFGEQANSLRPEDQFGALLGPERTPQRLVTHDAPFTLQFNQTAPDGSRRWFEATGQPIPHSSHDGDAPSGVVVIRDITDRSLRHLQDEFLALASHELRSPLTALSASLQLLRRRLGDTNGDPRVAGYITQATQQANQLALLINDLVDVVRLQTGRLRVTPQPLDLNALVEQTAEVGRTLTQGQTIEVETPAEPVRVNGDAGRLQQALLNLLTNAITYAPGSKRIELRLRRVEDQAVLEVRDYGLGIPATDLDQIFTRFFQSEHTELHSRGGLGLGLYIVHEIATLHGGTVEVTSTEGRGGDVHAATAARW